jgi:hypothetical protein
MVLANNSTEKSYWMEEEANVRSGKVKRCKKEPNLWRNDFECTERASGKMQLERRIK